MRSPPSKGLPRTNAAPAATLTAKPSNVRVFGERGIKRASGVTRSLALFFKSSNISIPSFYLVILSFIWLLMLSLLLHLWILFLSFPGRYLDSRVLSLIKISFYIFKGLLFGRLFCQIVCRDGILQKEVLRIVIRIKSHEFKMIWS